jgi:release factor glutamine methyltransferase
VRKSIKHIASLILIPIVRWYLRKERTYTYQGTRIIVSPGVFHPGFFSSTGFVLEFLKEQPLTGKTLLELGCGTALVSIIAAKSGANVLATDLSLAAIANAKRNILENQVRVDVLRSDLFSKIDKRPFDWIIINPPYYARTPRNEAELAWNCGENFEYFRQLFNELGNFIHENSTIAMVLTKGCDLQKIFAIAGENGFHFHLLREKNVLFDEKDYLYRIRRVS